MENAVKQAIEQYNGDTVTIELFEDIWNGEDLIPGVYEFVNTKGHQVGSNWVAVFTEDNKTVIIPASQIKKIVISKE